MSLKLDPNEKDPYLLWAEIARLQAAVVGPNGFPTWQDAAVHERVLRVRAEKARGKLEPLSENAVLHNVDQARSDCYIVGDQSDRAFWVAFAERLRVQWNAML